MTRQTFENILQERNVLKMYLPIHWIVSTYSSKECIWGWQTSGEIGFGKVGLLLTKILPHWFFYPIRSHHLASCQSYHSIQIFTTWQICWWIWSQKISSGFLRPITTCQIYGARIKKTLSSLLLIFVIFLQIYVCTSCLF